MWLPRLFTSYKTRNTENVVSGKLQLWTAWETCLYTAFSFRIEFIYWSPKRLICGDCINNLLNVERVRHWNSLLQGCTDSWSRTKLFMACRKVSRNAHKENKDRLCGIVVRDPGYRFRGPGSIPDFRRSSGSGTGSTQPREYNWGVNGVICVVEK
jgi:hypothetical protein